MRKIVLTLLLLTSCAPPRSVSKDLSFVRLGTTKTSVLANMGEPSGDNKISETETHWWYHNHDTACVIVFENEKATGPAQCQPST